MCKLFFGSDSSQELQMQIRRNPRCKNTNWIRNQRPTIFPDLYPFKNRETIRGHNCNLTTTKLVKKYMIRFSIVYVST